jgi:sugar phosphate isomerase/epimerase
MGLSRSTFYDAPPVPMAPNKVLVREHLRRACEFYNHLGDVCAEYGIRTGMHNHSQGQLVETQDEIETLLKLTDPKKFHWCPDTVHLYMANCDIIGLFTKYAHRLIFFMILSSVSLLNVSTPVVTKMTYFFPSTRSRRSP